jgi:hypothetical protein
MRLMASSVLILVNMKTAAGFTCMRRPRPVTQAFALAEAVIGMALVVLVLGMLFAMNGQLLSLLRQGKQSTYATELIAERVEHLRTAAGTDWDSMTIPGNFQSALRLGNTATETKLPGITEEFTVEPYDNPSGLRMHGIRPPGGVATVTGTALPNTTLVKVTIAVKWKSGHRNRERQFATVMSKHRS